MSGILQGLLASINAPAGPWLYSWGENGAGQLGDGTVTNRSSPVQIGDLTTWSKLSDGRSTSFAIKTDGTLWAWGNNDRGEIGDNTTIRKSSPVQVGALNTWSFVSSHLDYTCHAIRTDGTLWGWSRNDYGQIGDNTVIQRSSPVQVGALTNWSKVSAGELFCAAIKTDGTLWTWGRDFSGNLGLNTLNERRSSPVQVGALTTWSAISTGRVHCAAIKTDGTLWTWGYNENAQLGLNDLISRSSPVQVGASTNWSTVSCGWLFTVAIKTDGTLWAWGSNIAGQLGDNSIVYRSSPVQIGSLTNWSKVEGGFRTCAAIKTDKTLWTWGYNNSGQVGDNTVIRRSSPVQVGANTWSVVSCGRNFTLAIED